jgi:hypothetical protein
VELRNDDGRYASPGQGDLAAMDIGCQLEFSPGCITANGSEYSSGLSFYLESLEHTSAGGRASLILHARDGWGALGDWKARHQFRWNKTSDDMCVKDIIAVILAKVGLKLEVKSQSSTITGFYPDFTLNPDDNGRAVIIKLLSFVPDVLFIEGNKAYIVNPLSSDGTEYSYGVEHQIKEGRYGRGALGINRVQVEGYDTGTSHLILVNSFAWSEIDRLYDRLYQIEDRNLNSLDEAQQRGQAHLRQMEIEATEGIIIVPVNCGQQLYDVIDVTDTRTGLDAVKKRVLGLVLIYNPQRGEYFQRLELGGV